jgi:L-threonylcarbamoyladenylate synthase
MPKNYRWETIASKAELPSLLRSGNVVLGDSDTVIGLLAAYTQEGLQALDAIKERRNKPYLILVGSVEQAQELAIFPEDAGVAKLISCWPGPLTLIFKARPDSLACMQSSDCTVALRIPAHESLRRLAYACGGLFSTSANKTSLPVPERIEDVDPAIMAKVCCIVRNSDDTAHNALPSTILDCTASPVKLVREGAYSLKYLETIYGRPLSR